MFTVKHASGETGAASHVITRINSNVCLLEINSKPARNCQEKHGNFSSVVENLNLEFTSTLEKLFNFVCTVFVCRFEAFFAVNLLFKMCVILTVGLNVFISWPTCNQQTITHLILLRRTGTFDSKASYYRLEKTIKKRNTIFKIPICDHEALMSTEFAVADLRTTHITNLWSECLTGAPRNVANFSDIRFHLSYCMLFNSIFGNHF